MYNSIDRQISCIDTLIQFMKFIPIQADTFNQKIESKIKALVEKGLPEDLTNNYLENYWQNIKYLIGSTGRLKNHVEKQAGTKAIRHSESK